MQTDKLETILEDDGIIFLSYGGMLSQTLISGMTDALEKESQINGLSMKVTNNILTVFIELSQNMMNYSKHSSLNNSGFDAKGLIIVGHDKKNGYCYVTSRNILNSIDRKKITPKIEQVIPLDKDELKKLYRELRRSGRGKHDKGAGIGFVEIARRCDKIEYSFSEVGDNEDVHSFSFKAIINKERNMENLTLEATEYVPEIIMDADNGIISITGKSYPENTFEVYKPIMNWVEQYFDGNAQEKTTINIEIVYFNSSSSKLFFAFFKILDQAKETYKIEVNWLYHEENETALEAGEDLIADFEDLNINLIEKL